VLGLGLVARDAAALCVAGAAQIYMNRRFAWQTWRKLISTIVLLGTHGTNSHLPSFCVAGTALMALGGVLGLGLVARDAAALCVAGTAQTHSSLSHSHRIFTHTIFHHTIFHHTILQTPLYHTPSFTTPSFTHNFVTHHLSPHHLSHTTLSHTIFHTQLCHTLSFTHNFRTHHLSHTALSHTCSEISYRIIDMECITHAQTLHLNLTGESG